MALISYARHDVGIRPWGDWEVIDLGEPWVVKRLTLKPGQAISRQLHNHRAEVWTVLQGEAEVEVDSLRKILVVGETIHIPVRATHRLRNPCTNHKLVVSEVQYGELLSEDDIERFT